MPTAVHCWSDMWSHVVRGHIIYNLFVIMHVFSSIINDGSLSLEISESSSESPLAGLGRVSSYMYTRAIFIRGWGELGIAVHQTQIAAGGELSHTRIERIHVTSQTWRLFETSAAFI